MDQKNTKKVLSTFAFRVKKQAKSNLTRKGKKASGELYDSINSKVKVSKNSFEVSFDLADHWEFVDYGVKGVGGTKADGTKWKKKRVTNRTFKYRNKRPPAKVFSSWIVKKGIAPRNKKGQFTTRKGLMFAIANSVYHTGLETTKFFTKPFENEFKKLGDEVLKAYSLDLEDFLEFSLKD